MSVKSDVEIAITEGSLTKVMGLIRDGEGIGFDDLRTLLFNTTAFNDQGTIRIFINRARSEYALSALDDVLNASSPSDMAALIVTETDDQVIDSVGDYEEFGMDYSIVLDNKAHILKRMYLSIDSEMQDKVAGDIIGGNKALTADEKSVLLNVFDNFLKAPERFAFLESLNQSELHLQVKTLASIDLSDLLINDNSPR